ncbi:AaceriAEL069CAp [[Ashbya] aceris (nom. inval.)]|nr:AaceriAEL069CAp [[Ashbya] aceris (nom. inval.)]
MLVQLASPNVLDYSVCQALLSGEGERILDVYKNGSSAGGSTFIVVCERSIWSLHATGNGIRRKRIASCKTPVQKSFMSEGAVLAIQDNWVYRYTDEGLLDGLAMPVHAYRGGINIIGDAKQYYVDSRHSRYIWGPYKASALPQTIFELAEPVLDFHFDGSRAFFVKRLSHGRGYYIERVESVTRAAEAKRNVLSVSDDTKHAPIFSEGSRNTSTYAFVGYRYTWVIAQETFHMRKFPNPPFIKRAVTQGASLYVEVCPRGAAPRGPAPLDTVEKLVLRICTRYGAAYKSTLDPNLDSNLRWSKLRYDPRPDTFNGCWHIGFERYLYSTGKKLILKDFNSGKEVSVRHASLSEIVYDLCILQLFPVLENNVFSMHTLTCGAYSHYDKRGFIATTYGELSVTGLQPLTLSKAVASGMWPSVEDIWLFTRTSASAPISDSSYLGESGRSLHSNLDWFQDILFCATVQNASGIPTKYILLRADGNLLCCVWRESAGRAFEIPTNCMLNERTLLSSFENGIDMFLVAATDGIITVFELKLAENGGSYTLSNAYLLATIPEVICSINCRKSGVYVLTTKQLYNFGLGETPIRSHSRIPLSTTSMPSFCSNGYGQAVLFHDEDYLYQYCDGHMIKAKLPHRCASILQVDENNIYMLAVDSKLWRMKVIRKAMRHTYMEEGTVFTKVTCCDGSTRAILSAESGGTNTLEKLVLYDFGPRIKLAEYGLEPSECVINLYSFIRPVADGNLSNHMQICIATTYTAATQYIRLFVADERGLSSEDRVEVQWIITDIQLYGQLLIASGERLAIYFLQEENGRLTLTYSGIGDGKLRSSLTMGTVMHERSMFFFDAYKGIEVFQLFGNGPSDASLTRSNDTVVYAYIEHNTITHVASKSIPWHKLFTLNAAADITRADICFDDRKALWHSVITFAAVCDASGCVTLFQLSPASIERGTQICRFDIKQTILKLVPISTHLTEHMTELPTACTPLFALYLEDGSVRIISNGKITPDAQLIGSPHNLRTCRYLAPSSAPAMPPSTVPDGVFSFGRQRTAATPSKSAPHPLSGTPCIRIFVSDPPNPLPQQHIFSPPEPDLTL